MLTILSLDGGIPVPQYSGDISDGGTFQRRTGMLHLERLNVAYHYAQISIQR